MADDGDEVHDYLRKVAHYVEDGEEDDGDGYFPVCLVQSAVFRGFEGAYSQNAGDKDGENGEVRLEEDHLSVSVIGCAVQNVVSPTAVMSHVEVILVNLINPHGYSALNNQH